MPITDQLAVQPEKQFKPSFGLESEGQVGRSAFEQFQNPFDFSPFCIASSIRQSPASFALELL